MFKALAIATVGLTLAALPASAQSKLDTQFQTWLQNDLWPDAKAAGVSRETFDSAFAGVKPNLKLPDLVLPGQKAQTPKNQHQAEFNSPSNYFAEKIIGAVVKGGRARVNDKSLASVEKRYGVPRSVVLAIWGRESGFGAAKIPYNAFEVLGTKAWISTRQDMFRTELIAALQMLDSGAVNKDMMKSSWAGALGQPQFLPTSFQKHAVDFDGDRKKDIWNDEADTAASIAKYLVDYGWAKGRSWGYEAIVPEAISCALEGPDQGKTFAAWEQLGVTRAGGKPFPAAEKNREGFLLMPAGRNGPAFIVTKNFYVLKEYNESDLYALFVGHGADRIAGGAGGFSADWGKVDKLYRSDIAVMQRALEKKGYDVGSADGLPGFKTRRSIGDWQAKSGEAPTCFPSKQVVNALE